MERASVKYYKFFCCILITVVISVLHININEAADDNSQVIRVGVFEYGMHMHRHDDRTFYGYDIEYINEIMRYIGYKIEFVKYDTWTECWDALENGAVDILPDVHKTEERESRVLYSEYPMGMLYSAIVTRADDERYAYKDYKAFNSMKLGVIAGSTDAENIMEYCKINNISPAITEYENIGEMYKDLDDGRIDGMSTIQMGTGDKYKVVEKFSPEYVYLAISMEREDIAEQINIAQQKLQMNSPEFISYIYNKYFESKEQKNPVFTREEMAFIENIGPLTVYYNKNFEPLEYTDETGKFSGIVADVFDLVSQNSNLDFVFIPMDKIDNNIYEQQNAIFARVNNDYGIAGSKNYYITFPYLQMPLVQISNGEEKNASEITAAFCSVDNIEEIVKDNIQGASVRYYETMDDLCEAVRTGEADICYMSSIMAEYYLSKEKYSSLKSVTLSRYSKDISIGISEDSAIELKSILDKSVKSISDSQMNTIILRNSITRSENIVNEIVKKNSSIMISSAFIVFGVTVFGLSYALFLKYDSNKKIKKLLYLDKLTGLWNIDKFRMEIKQILKKSKNMEYAFIYCDINQFKVINDTLGFSAGDTVLQELARVILEIIEEDEYCARVSSDHFVMMLKYTDWQTILMRTELLSEKINIRIRDKLNNCSLVMSYGVYIVNPDESDDIDRMLDCAIYAHESIQNPYKSQVALYDDKLREEAVYQREILERAEYALKNKEFILYIQPKVDMRNGNVEGGEALIRWEWPGKGIVLPGKFISLFEKNGFIKKIDFCIFEQVCRLQRKWIDIDIPMRIISSNFSRLHFEDKNFIDNLCAIADHYNVPYNYLEIELTESIAMNQSERVISYLSRLRNLGFQIAIDDYGSGYSCLEVLQNLRIDVLKLDRLLIDKGTENEKGRIILENVIAMAKKLNLSIVCEGVKDEAQAARIVEMGCNIAQSFHYGMPMPADEFEALLLK